jgi:hypothetical protein
MKYTTVEDVIASFPNPILPTVQGELDYQTIHAIRKLLQANAWAIDTHLGGGDLGQLGIISIRNYRTNPSMGKPRSSRAGTISY